MQAVFTSKNKGFSRLYERKLTQSYTTSRDGFQSRDETAMLVYKTIENYGSYFA